MGKARQQTFHAEVSGRSIELILNEDHVSIDDQQVPFSHEAMSETRLSLIVDGRSYSAVVIPQPAGGYVVSLAGREFDVQIKDERDLLLERYGLAETAAAGVQAIRAPMPGLVLSVAVEPGQHVSEGTGLAVLEAMKMENELRAEHDGTVKAVHVSPGDAVGKNDLLLELE